MPTVSRDDLKKKGINRLFKSFKYAYEGLKYAFKYEQNILVHFLATILVIIAGIFFKISMTEWLVLTLIIGLVIATELINTSIEATIDLVTKEVHPLAKVAKDCGSAASFVMSIVSVVISLFVFGPYFLEVFDKLF